VDTLEHCRHDDVGGPAQLHKCTKTRRRGKAQRVARTACANATVYFLLTYRLAVLLSPGEWY